MKRAGFLVCLLTALAVILAGCGDDGSSDSAQTGASAAAAAAATAAAEAAEEAKRPEKGAWGVAFGAEGKPLGLIIYDLAGHTLYTYSKDKGGKSSCYGACAKTWPPALTEGKTRAGGEAIAAKVGTTKRKDGTVQITYAGHPLYRYSGDKQIEVKGHGRESFGGKWYAIRPNGEKP